MSIIQSIRDKAAWIIIAAIALALIAFIVQDAFQNQRLLGGNDTTLGRVNGTKINAIDFETRLKKLEDIYVARGMPLDESNRQNERDRLWNEYVEKAVMVPEYDKLGLEVTDKEVGDILYGANPPQDLRQQFTDPKTGAYMADQAYQQISQIRKQKTSEAYKSFFGEYIPALVNFRKREKFDALMRNSLYAPKWLVEKTNTENSQIASISYVNIPYNTIGDSTLKVTDEEINDYIAKHKDAFRQDKARAIEYVVFDAGPTKADSQAVLQRLESLKDTFAKTTDAKTFLLNENSQSQYFDSYVNKKAIKIPNIDSIVNTPPGQVFGPYPDGDGYTLARVIATKSWPDSVNVRHILISTQQQNPQTGQMTRVRDDSSAKKLADSIALAIKNGSSFDSLVTRFSEDPGSRDSGGVYKNVPSGKMVPEFNEFIFDNKPGAKGVVKTDFGYHYIEVLSHKGGSPAYKIAYLAKPILASEETINAASGLASQFAAESRNQKQFDDNAKKRNLNKFNAADIKPMQSVIMGLNGSARELVRWMFRDAEVGDVAEHPYFIGDKYVVPVLTMAFEKGTMTADRARPQIEARIRNEKRAAEMSKKIAGAKTLEEVSKLTNQPVNKADSILFSNTYVPNVGQETKVLGAAFNKNNQTKISDPIAGEMGVFIIKTESIGAVANPAMDVKFQQNMMVQNARMGQDPIRVLMDAANIKDYRYNFF